MGMFSELWESSVLALLIFKAQVKSSIKLPSRIGIGGEIKEGETDLKAFYTNVVNTDVTVRGASSEDACMKRKVKSLSNRTLSHKYV